MSQFSIRVPRKYGFNNDNPDVKNGENHWQKLEILINQRSKTVTYKPNISKINYFIYFHKKSWCVSEIKSSSKYYSETT